MDERASSVVVVGASAGGVEALTTLVAGLPSDLDAAVCVVLHLRADGKSRLAHILSRAGPLTAEQAIDGDALEPGRIYVGSPDRHLEIAGGHVRVGSGPRERGFRPSIDVLFRSAAGAYGSRTVAVVLSGTRDDGVAGATIVGENGGCVLVQDPASARFADLPLVTVAHDEPDGVVPLPKLAGTIAARVERLSRERAMSDNGAGELSGNAQAERTSDE